MQLFINAGGSESFLLNLICSYLKLEERGAIKIIALSQAALKAQEKGSLKLLVPSLVTKQGQTMNQTFQIARYLLSLQSLWAQFFLGADEQQKKQIANIKTHLKEGKQLRKHLQKYLEPRTFFVGNHLTFADIFMFTRLYDNITEMTDQQKNQYHNLFRWYKHIQNLPEIRKYLQSTNRILVQNPKMKLSMLEVKKPKKK